MELYTKRHLLLTAFCSAVFAIILAICALVIFEKLSADKSSDSIFSQSQINSAQQLVTGETGSLSTDVNSNMASSSSLVSDLVGYTQDELQNINVYEQYSPAVVNINTQVMAVNWFLEPVPQEGGSGSGSIIDKEGYVVTNVHVIKNAYRIYISLSDGTQYEGTVVGTDIASDIAVLKFDPPKGVELKTIAFSDSDNLRVGQKVIAIGNPFGLERTMTTGIISGLGRPIQSSNETIIRDMIQTDTAINPGNSGGPLLDTQGRMIGINTIIYSTSGSSAGIGFAVPVNTAKRVVADLIAFGEVQRGRLDAGAKLVQLTASIASYANLSVSQGLLVSELTRGGIAEQGGLRAGTESVRYGSRRDAVVIYLGGDIITYIDGVPVSTFADYYSLLESKKPGDKVDITVQRGRQEEILTIRLGE